MNCVAETVKVEFKAGHVGSAKYEFTYLQSESILGQNRSCFLVLDLQNFMILEKPNDQVEEKDKKQTDCFIAAFFACGKNGYAHHLKEKFTQIFKENIYTQMGDILLGFQNSLGIFEAYITSQEVKSEMDCVLEKKLWLKSTNNTDITANIILRQNGNIYSSQINSAQKNLIGIKLKNSAVYQKIQINKLKPLSDNCFQLDQQKLSDDDEDIDELILSNMSNNLTDLTNKNTSKYPTYVTLMSCKNVNFLRITKLTS